MINQRPQRFQWRLKSFTFVKHTSQRQFSTTAHYTCNSEHRTTNMAHLFSFWVLYKMLLVFNFCRTFASENNIFRLRKEMFQPAVDKVKMKNFYQFQKGTLPNLCYPAGKKYTRSGDSKQTITLGQPENCKKILKILKKNFNTYEVVSVKQIKL